MVNRHIRKYHEHHILHLVGAKVLFDARAEEETNCGGEIRVRLPAAVGRHLAHGLGEGCGGVQLDPRGVFAERHDAAAQLGALGDSQTESDGGVERVAILGAHRVGGVDHGHKVVQRRERFARLLPLEL